jgi:hypothetical protein
MARLKTGSCMRRVRRCPLTRLKSGCAGSQRFIINCLGFRV